MEKIKKTSKKRDKADSKRRLMEAAVAVFSEVGYDAATTKLVASQAGLNESLIQRYFEGKQGLLLAVIKTFAETQEACSHEYPPGATLEEEILNFLTSRIEDDCEKQTFMRVVISRAILDSKISEEMSRHTYKGGLPAIRERLKELQRKGKIRADADVERAGLSLCGQGFMLGFMAQVVFRMEPAQIQAIAREVASVYARGLS